VLREVSDEFFFGEAEQGWKHKNGVMFGEKIQPVKAMR
jgi:hypothetical protein